MSKNFLQHTLYSKKNVTNVCMYGLPLDTKYFFHDTHYLYKISAWSQQKKMFDDFHENIFLLS